MSLEEIALEAEAKEIGHPPQGGTREKLRSFVGSQLAVNPRLLRVMMLISFDVIVIGELLLWNAYLVCVMIFELQMNDFGRFYYSAVAYLKGMDMYSPSPATLLQLDRSHSMQFWNLNPPHFHVPLLLLAMLRPGSAVVIWGVTGTACLFLSWILVKNEIHWSFRGPWAWRLPVAGTLMFAGTGASLITGQLSFLLLLIVTLCWLHARRGCWNKAGIFLGLAVSLKPFLLIFFPYLVLRRQFRAIFVCMLIVLLSFGTGLLVFGLDAHVNWLRAVSASSEWTWATMNASALGFLSRVLAPSPYFSPVTIAPHLIKAYWLLIAGLIFVLTMAATMGNPNTRSLDWDFALLLVAALLISPLGWIYYLWLPFGPIAALLRSRAGDRSATMGGTLKWRNGLLWGSMLAFIVPTHALVFFQPSPWATILLGSSYFWGTLALWSGLFLDPGAKVHFRNRLLARTSD